MSCAPVTIRNGVCIFETTVWLNPQVGTEGARRTPGPQVAPQRVRELYADLGSKEKIIVDLACSSHNAMWERNHLLLFKASLDWLRDGKVNGISEGELKLGY